MIGLAALWHARQYGFFCDDAFIALRYAKHLIEHHELVYNLGQRVEGFTSPLWVLLVSTVGSLGVPLLSATRVLAGSAGLLTFWALTLFWDEAPAQGALARARPGARAGDLRAVRGVDLRRLGDAAVRRHVHAFARATGPRHAKARTPEQPGGRAVCCVCVLSRPEGATLIALGSALLCLPEAGPAELRSRRLLAWFLPILLLVGGYELFRLRYYGYLCRTRSTSRPRVKGCGSAAWLI